VSLQRGRVLARALFRGALRGSARHRRPPGWALTPGASRRPSCFGANAGVARNKAVGDLRPRRNRPLGSA
jgi:hypothetical protein